MKKAEIVLSFLVPAYEDGAEAVEPGMGAFDHPAPGFCSGAALESVGLFAPCADVRGEAELLKQLVDLSAIVVLIHAHALGVLRRRLWSFGFNALDSFTGEFEESCGSRDRLPPPRERLWTR